MKSCKQIYLCLQFPDKSKGIPHINLSISENDAMELLGHNQFICPKVVWVKKKTSYAFKLIIVRETNYCKSHQRNSLLLWKTMDKSL